MEGRTQRLVAGGFITHRGRLLIARRSSSAGLFPGHYELPGGKVESGESPEQALKREVREELGIEIKVLRPYHTFTYLSPDRKTHFVEVDYLARLSGSPGEIRPAEHEDIQWVTRKDLASFRMSEQAREAMEKGFEALGQN